MIVSDQSSNCRNEVAQGLVCRSLPSELSPPPGSRDSITAGGPPGAAPPDLRAALGLARRVETKALTSYLLLMTVHSHFLQFLSGFNIGESPAPLVPEMFSGEGRIGSAFA
jgi:hypothetical protein